MTTCYRPQFLRAAHVPWARTGDAFQQLSRSPLLKFHLFPQRRAKDDTEFYGDWYDGGDVALAIIVLASYLINVTESDPMI